MVFSVVGGDVDGVGCVVVGMMVYSGSIRVSGYRVEWGMCEVCVVGWCRYVMGNIYFFCG